MTTGTCTTSESPEGFGSSESGDVWEWSSLALVFTVPSAESPAESDHRAPASQRVKLGVSGSALTATGDKSLRAGVFSSALGGQDSTQELSYRWFRSSGLVNAVPSSDKDGGGYSFWKLSRSSGRLQNPSDALDKLEEAGILIAGFSRARAAIGEDFVVVHIVQRGNALREPQWLPAALHRPAQVPDLGAVSGEGVLSGKALQESVNMFLKQMGVPAKLSYNGQAQWTAFSSRNVTSKSPIYVITTAVPKAATPECPPVSPRADLDPAAQWANLVTGCAAAVKTPDLVDFSPAGVSRSLVSLRHSQAWCGERGMGIVADPRPAGGEDVWATSVAHAIMLAHSVFADLVYLVSAQDTFLRDRAKDLAEYAGQAKDGDTAEVAAKYRRAQAQLIGFLGGLWFEEVPRRDSATRVLRSMQASRYLPDRLTHIEREHSAFLRYLEAQEQQARDIARERRVEVEKREAAMAAELQGRRDETSHIIQVIAAVILPTTLVFTITGGTGIELNLWAIVMAVVVSVLLTVIFVPRRAVSDLRRGRPRLPDEGDVNSEIPAFQKLSGVRIPETSKDGNSDR